jgi:PAS domain S-box-containing protein
MINLERVEELKRYVEFSSADCAHLVALHPLASPEFARIASAFYDKIREHEGAHAVFTGEEQIARLHRSLEGWMGRLLGGKYDLEYFQKTARIGEVHVRIGLPQRYMFTAMALIRAEFMRIVDERVSADRRFATCSALGRVLDLDLAVMLEAYHDAYYERADRRNVFEKEELTASLARTERRYTTAVELTRELIVGLAGDGTIRLFNSAAERVTGYGREEVIGKAFAEVLLDPPDHAALNSILENARKDSAVAFKNLTIRARTGREREVRWQVASTTTDGEPGVDGIDAFLIGHDETDERALAQRTQQSERLASIGTLAAGLAHEIRNPLNGAQLHVSYLTRALSKMGDKPDLVEAALVVDDEIKRLAALVTEFLDFARPKPLAKNDVGLIALCERVLPLIAPAARTAHVTVTHDYPQKEIIVSGDAAKLEQVLLNLAQNAVEALSSTGGGHVKVRVRRQPKHAILEVEDDGPGLPSPDAPIYDAFYSTKPNGTGLGLAITHRIVTDHGGTIDASSKPGHTVFRIHLPIEHHGVTS